MQHSCTADSELQCASALLGMKGLKKKKKKNLNTTSFLNEVQNEKHFSSMTQACMIWNCPQVYVPLHHAGRSCTHPCWASQHAPESWHTFGRRRGAYASQRDHGRCTWGEEQQPISHHFWHKRSKRSFQHPSSKLCCNWLHHCKGTLYLLTCVYFNHLYVSPMLSESPVCKSHAVRITCM